jgi:hypothetical protein
MSSCCFACRSTAVHHQGSGGAAGCADEVAGLPRCPGRVASGGEAEANVAWPPTRRARNLRSLRERAQAGPERSRSPRGCLQPPLSASRPDPTQKIDPRAEGLEGRKSWSHTRKAASHHCGRDASPARPEGLRRPPRRKMPGLVNHRTRAASRPQPASEGARAPSEQVDRSRDALP